MVGIFKRALKVYLIVIGICLFMTLIYFLAGSKGSPEIWQQFSNLNPVTISNYNKTTQFLTSWIKSTGDTSLAVDLGYSEDDISGLLEPVYDGVEGADGSATNPGTATGSDKDLRNYAKECCRLYISWKIGDDGKYYSTSKTKSFTLNGLNITMHPCCAGLVSYVNICRLGTDAYHNDNAASWIKANGFTNIMNDVKTCNDFEVGDVVVWDHHVEIIVFKDTGYVYVANAGSNNAIEQTAEDGYYKKYKLSDSHEVETSRTGKTLLGIMRK